MVVQHNLTAMNSNRMLGVTMGTLAKSTEKLSSGYKVNRAADDAAGLSISEKMRKQMRGLTQASLNAQDGISSVQTAEGALTEVHEMLQRMNELAVKSANGTNSESDRQAIQDEINQLVTEIDRVAETTKFNETYLLKGEPEGGKKTITLAAHDAGLKGKLIEDENGRTTTFALEKVLETGDKVSIGGKEYVIAASKDREDYQQLSSNYSFNVGDTITLADGSKTYRITTAGASGTAKVTEVSNEGKLLAPELSVAQTTALLVADNTYFNAVTGITSTFVGKMTTNMVNANSKVVTADELKDIIVNTHHLEEGSKIKIGTDPDLIGGGVEYTLSATTDRTAKKLSLDDLMLEISDGKYVGIGAITNNVSAAMADDANAFSYYILPSETGEDNEISKVDAYKLMATELEKASSIGTDEGHEAKVKVDMGKGKFTITQGSVEVTKSLAFSLHVGADADMTNKIGVNIDAMDSKGLGIQNLKVIDVEGSTATYAIDAIADAVAKVSAQRSLLGAVQNRLEHTIKNLDNIIENTTAAESQIRDTDMATEMVKYSNNNILAQAGQSMLAQSNQSNQGILSLLG